VYFPASPPYILTLKSQQIRSEVVKTQLTDKIVGCVLFLRVLSCVNFLPKVSENYIPNVCSKKN
jgi:hypothetical protein